MIQSTLIIEYQRILITKKYFYFITIIINTRKKMVELFKSKNYYCNSQNIPTLSEYLFKI